MRVKGAVMRKVAKPSRKPSSWAHLGMWLKSVEEHPVSRLAGIIVKVLGFVGLAWGLYEIRNTVANQRDVLVNQQWDRIGRRASGNSGVGEALTKLHAAGQELNQIDVSCANIGRMSSDGSSCIGPPILTGLYLSVPREEIWPMRTVEVQFRNLVIRGLKLSGAEIEDSAIRNVTLTEIDARDAKFRNLDAVSMTMIGTLDGLTLDGSRLVDTVWQGKQGEAISLGSGEVSGASFINLSVSHQVAMAWADAPPRIIKLNSNGTGTTRPMLEAGISLILCNPDGQPQEVFERARLNMTDDRRAKCESMSLDDAKKRFPEAYVAGTMNR